MSGDVHVRNFPGVRFPPGRLTLGVHCLPVPAGGRRHGLPVPRKVLRSQRFELCGELGESVRQPADVRAGRTTRQVGHMGGFSEAVCCVRPWRLRTPPPRFVINPSATCPNGRPPAMRSTANGCRRQGRQRGRAAAPPVPFSAGFLSGSVSLHGLCPIDRDGGTRCGDRRGCRELRRGRLLERGGRHLGGTPSRERDGWWNLRRCSRFRRWERRGGGGGFPDGRHRLSRLGRRGLRGRRGPIRQDREGGSGRFRAVGFGPRRGAVLRADGLGTGAGPLRRPGLPGGGRTGRDSGSAAVIPSSRESAGGRRNVAVLGTLGFPEGTVPDGFAVPFYQ